jgi:hypothetical protein
MKELYAEGLASHGGHESCTGCCEAVSEALDSGKRRLGIEPRKHATQVPTRLRTREGNTERDDNASLLRTWRGRRPQMGNGSEPKSSYMRGNSLHGNREISGFATANEAGVRDGNPVGASQR